MATPKKSYDYLFKILFIGDSNAGKTRLLFDLTRDMIPPEFISTVGIDFKIRTTEHDGKRIKAQLWDTAGQERFITITNSYYRGAMGIFLVFNMCSEKAFDNLTGWVTNIKESANENVEVILIGNRRDEDTTEKVVSSEQGRALADQHGFQFYETDPENGEMEAAFNDMIGRIYAKILREKEEKEEEEEEAPEEDVSREDAKSNRCMIM